MDTHSELMAQHDKVADEHMRKLVEFSRTPWWRLMKRARLHREATDLFQMATRLFERATALYLTSSGGTKRA